MKAWHIPTASQFTLDAPKGRVLAMTAGYDTLLAGAEVTISFCYLSVSAIFSVIYQFMLNLIN